VKDRHQLIDVAERVKRALAMALLSTAFAGALFAWGQEGHRITAELAQRHLDPAARAAVDEILGGESLAQVAFWPDEIKSYPSWDCAQPFHYVTVPVGAQYPDQGVAEGDAVQALVYFSDLLREREQGDPDSRIALAFVVHLVGDLHQPLHSGRGCDRGGNALKVNWFGDSVNFHTVWDSLLIQSENLSFNEWADFLDHADEGEVARVQSATPVDWVRQSQDQLDSAYTCFTGADRCPCFCGGCADGGSMFGGCATRECRLMAAGPVQMSYTYKTVNLEVVRRQLLEGGLRLAGLLDWIFAGPGEPPEAFARMADEIRGLGSYDRAAMDACRGESSVQAAPADDVPAAEGRPLPKS